MDILDERETTHGPFMLTAFKAQQLKNVMAGGKHWNDLDDIQREALQMIASKIARILSGNFNEIDHWRDIAGYANLAVRDLTGISSEKGPIPRPGEHNFGTFPLAQASCVWPDEEEAPDI